MSFVSSSVISKVTKFIRHRPYEVSFFQILIQPPEEEDRGGRPDDAQDFFCP
jgi:hypothetical protein